MGVRAKERGDERARARVRCHYSRRPFHAARRHLALPLRGRWSLAYDAGAHELVPGNVHLITRCDLCIDGPGAVELGCHYGVQFWRQSLAAGRRL